MNEGNIDRIIRVIAGIIAIVLAFFIDITAWKIVLWILGAILFVTGVAGFCLLYSIFHISTKPKSKQ